MNLPPKTLYPNERTIAMAVTCTINGPSGNIATPGQAIVDVTLSVTGNTSYSDCYALCWFGLAADDPGESNSNAGVLMPRDGNNAAHFTSATYNILMGGNYLARVWVVETSKKACGTSSVTAT